MGKVVPGARQESRESICELPLSLRRFSTLTIVHSVCKYTKSNGTTPSPITIIMSASYYRY